MILEWLLCEVAAALRNHSSRSNDAWDNDRENNWALNSCYAFNMSKPSLIIHRVSGPLCSCHGWWGADPDDQRDQEDIEPVLERKL